MKKTAILLGALAIGTAMPALAHDMDHTAQHEAMTRYYFYKMDTDGNGYISRAEHEAFAAGMFTRADANMDGFLTYHELLAFKANEWNDFHDNYLNRSGEYYEGEKYYPYGKNAPTLTPNEPYKANHGKTTRDWRDYQTRTADDWNRDPNY